MNSNETITAEMAQRIAKTATHCVVSYENDDPNTEPRFQFCTSPSEAEQVVAALVAAGFDPMVLTMEELTASVGSELATMTGTMN